MNELVGNYAQKQEGIRKNEKLDEKEKKIFAGTYEGRVLSSLKAKEYNYATHIAKQTGLGMPTVGLALNRLIRAGIVEGDKKGGIAYIDAVHLDEYSKIREILTETKLYKINEYIEKNHGLLSPNEVCLLLKVDYGNLNEGIKYLLDSGLIREIGGGKPKGRKGRIARYFYPVESSREE